ncbi:ATP-binding protein [Guyparkeria hydrothermalis]|uniref:ATP-binding protein n=1 Tax=Guyparkeria hydrothermalis TaxID=923 RepID=UPI0020215A31|nr:ATP-binding protein [Guyparkeria hydrothermalis]MCL7750243.1 ATP-binding protein [Guyparkeria hydrothermalis]
MKLERLEIKNFRAYQEEVSIKIGDLTALIGRNDVGKTTVLDALGVFFNNKSCKYDPTDKCVFASDDEDVEITCVFSDLPERLVIDSSSETTLRDEYLLDSDGMLSLSRVFKKGKGAGAYFVNCIHPSSQHAKGTLLKKNSDLKSTAQHLGVAADDNRSNVSLRQAIYGHLEDLELTPQRVSLSKEDGKEILDQVLSKLPHFALFRADRPSTDEEAEVQDPMKVAVSHALQELDDELDAIKVQVRDRALDVANKTLKHLAGFDPDLAMDLSPVFRADPKWESVFKLSLTGDDDIPINKRGSGVRRLVLISFFKAEAEKIREESEGNGVIYAIEEPETSQHPDKQRLLIESLVDMSESDGCQILLTTHVPGLAEQLPVQSLRHVRKNSGGHVEVDSESSEMCEVIARDLGVLPDSRARVIVCVEGPHDVSFLKGISKVLRDEGVNVPDLANDPRIVLLPLGGDTLRNWVNNNYLKSLGKPEVHIYDRDESEPPKYQSACDEVNARGDGSVAFLTRKRECENYFHPDAINESLSVHVSITDNNNVPQDVATALSIKERTAKRKLNREAVYRMNRARLEERDPAGEVAHWLAEIDSRLRG